MHAPHLAHHIRYLQSKRVGYPLQFIAFGQHFQVLIGVHQQHIQRISLRYFLKLVPGLRAKQLIQFSPVLINRGFLFELFLEIFDALLTFP